MPGDDIRLNPSSYAVLALLKAAGESTPYELKSFLEKSVENFWPVPHTTFYAEPARLAAGGYLSERQEQTGRRRKLYALTEKGREALEEWVHNQEYPPPQLRDDGALKIFAGAEPLPILERRAEWHRAKLAELEGYLEQMDPNAPAAGPRGSLTAGIAYHRALLGAVEEFLATAGAPNGGATESAVPGRSGRAAAGSAAGRRGDRAAEAAASGASAGDGARDRSARARTPGPPDQATSRPTRPGRGGR